MSSFARQLPVRVGCPGEAVATSPVHDAPPRLFAGILPADYAAIAASARSRQYARGEILFLEGDSVHHVVLLISGIVKIAQNGKSGSEVILGLGIAGDVLGASSLLTTGKHHATAEAFRSCRVLVWEERAFRGLTERFPILHKNAARILDQDFLELAERFREVATEKVGLRVARQLSRLQHRIGRQVGSHVEIGLSRDELARMTGTTLFTVSRLLSRWEASGILKPSRESVTITNHSLLKSVCDEAE